MRISAFVLSPVSVGFDEFDGGNELLEGWSDLLALVTYGCSLAVTTQESLQTVTFGRVLLAEAGVTVKVIK